jgi:hypothetical protein
VGQNRSIREILRDREILKDSNRPQANTFLIPNRRLCSDILQHHGTTLALSRIKSNGTSLGEIGSGRLGKGACWRMLCFQTPPDTWGSVPSEAVVEIATVEEFADHRLRRRQPPV